MAKRIDEDTPVTSVPSVVSPKTRSRLSDADAIAMYHDLSIHELGKLSFTRLSEMHPEPYRTYVVDRNINYSNVCTAKCIFCNFKTDPGNDDAYILSYEQIGEKIEELIDIGGTQILMQGGLVPGGAGGAGVSPAIPPEHTLPFAWYLDLLRFIKTNYPTIHIHAFSPPEIWAFAEVYRMPLRDVLLRLQDAGLATIPGGGGEILVDRVRRKIGQGKTLSAEWLEVMRQAHKLGMKTSCTMMMGHIETIEERIEHMRLLRDLQDETGGFTAFIHWPFQPDRTKLGRWKRLPTGEHRPLAGANSHEPTKLRSDADDRTPDQSRDRMRDQSRDRTPNQNRDRMSDQSRDREGAGEGEAPAEPLPVGMCTSEKVGTTPDHSVAGSPQYTKSGRPLNDGNHLLLADGHEYLVWLAISRLYLDNVPNIQSSWVTMGPKIGQLALMYGANDMGSVMMEENVVSQAGASYRLDEDMIRRLITDAGWQPQQRDQYYRPVATERKRRPLPAKPRLPHGVPSRRDAGL
jgi:cyclic dehypoxanthinyl futalosine synthase